MSRTRSIAWSLAAMAALLVAVPAALPGGGKSAAVKLPDAVVKALKDAFPKTAIPKVGEEKDGLWNVALGKKGEIGVSVADDGTITTIKTRATEKDLSEAALKTIQAMAEGARILDVARTEIRASLRQNEKKFVKLAKPMVLFDVTLMKETRTAKLAVLAEGAVPGLKVPRLEWKDLAHAAGKVEPGQLVIRVACGSDKDYTDLSGAVWFADQKYAKDKKWGYSNGKTSYREGISFAGQTDAPELYLRERYYHDNYRFDVPNGKYTVRVHMCETWEGASKPGQRSFGLKIQDQIVQKVDFDLVRDVGFMKPHIKEVKDVNVTDGKIIVHFIDNGKHQHPLVNAIEVIGPVQAGAKQGD